MGPGRGRISRESGKTRPIESSSERAEYNAEVNAIIRALLTEYNDRDATAVRQHLYTLLGAIEGRVEGSVDMVFGGSVAKHTYVDGLSDIDVILRIGESDLEGKSPGEVLRNVSEMIKERLPNTQISVGTLAVTVSFSDGCEIQVLPAVEGASGIHIADESGREWSATIRPDRFAQKLTEVNQRCGGTVVPVIKVFKDICAALPHDIRINGYHSESLAVGAFDGYSGPLTYKDMLQHLLAYAVDRVQRPMTDRTGQSLHVDDALGETASVRRFQLSKHLQRIANRLETADERRSIELWKEVLR